LPILTLLCCEFSKFTIFIESSVTDWHLNCAITITSWCNSLLCASGDKPRHDPTGWIPSPRGGLYARPYSAPATTNRSD